MTSKKLPTDVFLRLDVRINAATHPELYTILNSLDQKHRTKRLVTLALIGHSRTADNMSAPHPVVTSEPRTSKSVVDSHSAPAIHENGSGLALSTSSIHEASKTYSVSESAADDIGELFTRMAATEQTS